MLASASADASGRLDAGDAPFARATAAAPPDADATANNASLDVAFRAMALSAATPAARARLTLTTEFAIRAGRAGADPRSAAPTARRTTTSSSPACGPPTASPS